MIDKELFELCTEVYEATGWRGEDGFITTIGGRWIKDAKKGWFDETIDSDGFYPLYTSDYLLEKLPYKIGKANSAIWLRLGKTRKGFTVCYMGSDLVCLYECQSDTPLKALLKLVIALNKAGVEL